MFRRPLSRRQAPLPPVRRWGALDSGGTSVAWTCLLPEGNDESHVGSAPVLDGMPLNVRSGKLARMEAALLVADVPLSPRKLMQFATLVDADEAKNLIDELNAAYDATGSAFRVEEVATGYRLLTRPEFSRWLSRLHHREAEIKLSPPALETLTIIAYRQPLTRADVESVRGVQSSEIIKQLLERGLVRIAGEDDSLGRPYLYETTRKFLELYGLQNLNELPMAETLRHSTKAKRQAAAEAQSTAAGESVAPDESGDQAVDDAVNQAKSEQDAA